MRVITSGTVGAVDTGTNPRWFEPVENLVPDPIPLNETYDGKLRVRFTSGASASISFPTEATAAAPDRFTTVSEGAFYGPPPDYAVNDTFDIGLETKYPQGYIVRDAGGLVYSDGKLVRATPPQYVWVEFNGIWTVEKDWNKTYTYNINTEHETEVGAGDGTLILRLGRIHGGTWEWSNRITVFNGYSYPGWTEVYFVVKLYPPTNATFPSHLNITFQGAWKDTHDGWWTEHALYVKRNRYVEKTIAYWNQYGHYKHRASTSGSGSVSGLTICDIKAT